MQRSAWRALRRGLEWRPPADLRLGGIRHEDARPVVRELAEDGEARRDRRHRALGLEEEQRRRERAGVLGLVELDGAHDVVERDLLELRLVAHPVREAGLPRPEARLVSLGTGRAGRLRTQKEQAAAIATAVRDAEERVALAELEVVRAQEETQREKSAR